eukprot:scaffold7330_cov146-Cylindrotheca_fusiformis.AAC.3
MKKIASYVFADSAVISTRPSSNSSHKIDENMSSSVQIWFTLPSRSLPGKLDTATRLFFATKSYILGPVPKENLISRDVCLCYVQSVASEKRIYGSNTRDFFCLACISQMIPIAFLYRNSV